MFITRATETNRGLANTLDQVEDIFAFLLAQRVAEQAAEQTDVVSQRQVFVDVFGPILRSRLFSGLKPILSRHIRSRFLRGAWAVEQNLIRIRVEQSGANAFWEEIGKVRHEHAIMDHGGRSRTRTYDLSHVRRAL